MNVPSSIVTERLSINLLAIADDNFILELVNTEGWLQFIGNRKISSEADARAYIQRISDNPNTFYWVVKLKDSGEKTGIVTFIKRDHLAHPDIGFAFLPQYFGNGYAYEASHAVLQQLTTEYNFATILAITIPENKSSISLLTRLRLAFEKELQADNEKLHVYSLSAAGTNEHQATK